MDKHEELTAFCKASGTSPQILASMKDAGEAIKKMSSGQIQDVMMAGLSELWSRNVIERKDVHFITIIMAAAAGKSEKRDKAHD